MSSITNFGNSVIHCGDSWSGVEILKTVASFENNFFVNLTSKSGSTELDPSKLWRVRAIAVPKLVIDIVIGPIIGIVASIEMIAYISFNLLKSALLFGLSLSDRNIRPQAAKIFKASIEILPDLARMIFKTSISPLIIIYGAGECLFSPENFLTSYAKVVAEMKNFKSFMIIN